MTRDILKNQFRFVARIDSAGELGGFWIMKRVLFFVLFGFVMMIAGYSLRLTCMGARPIVIGPSIGQSERKSDFNMADLAKFEWVDKRCRVWASDGDIDVDQTCLAVKTVRGGLVAIPNQYNDGWLKEIGDPKTSKDKWIQRFFSIGGGAKLK
jgi:hypothetical protein